MKAVLMVLALWVSEMVLALWVSEIALQQLQGTLL